MSAQRYSIETLSNPNWIYVLDREASMTAPCPFCGSSNTSQQARPMLSARGDHTIKCQTCLAEGPPAHSGDAANAAWAARAATAVEVSQRALIAALEAELAVKVEGLSSGAPRIKLPDDSSWPDPKCPALAEAAWIARHQLARLTQTQAYHLLAAVEAYQHLAAHPAGTESTVATLRALRRALRERGQR